MVWLEASILAPSPPNCSRQGRSISRDRIASNLGERAGGEGAEAESLLWYVRRGQRVCGLQFRRQDPIEPFIAELACVEECLVVEIVGGYHDRIDDNDEKRQKRLEASGGKVIRFSHEEVLDDVGSIAMAIAKRVGLEPTCRGKRFACDQPPHPNPHAAGWILARFRHLPQVVAWHLPCSLRTAPARCRSVPSPASIRVCGKPLTDLHVKFHFPSVHQLLLIFPRPVFDFLPFVIEEDIDAAYVSRHIPRRANIV